MRSDRARPARGSRFRRRPSSPPGGCGLTLPMMTFPSESLTNTSLFTPSSYGRYEPSGCVLLMPGSCVETSVRHEQLETRRRGDKGPRYHDHDVSLVVSVQVLDHVRQRGELGVQREIQEAIHVINVVPLDVLATSQSTAFSSPGPPGRRDGRNQAFT